MLCVLLCCFVFLCSFCNIGGQKIAKKLSTQVSKETRVLKALLQEYNACQAILTGNYSGLTLMDALDSSTLAHILHPKLCAYTPGKQEIINAYLIMTRSIEEIEMLQSEMQNIIYFTRIDYMLLKTLWAVFLSKDQSMAGVHMLFSSTFITVQKSI